MIEATIYIHGSERLQIYNVVPIQEIQDLLLLCLWILRQRYAIYIIFNETNGLPCILQKIK